MHFYMLLLKSKVYAKETQHKKRNVKQKRNYKRSRFSVHILTLKFVENVKGRFPSLNRSGRSVCAQHLSHSHCARIQQPTVRLPEEITDGLQSENGAIVQAHQHVPLSLRSCTDKRAVMKTSKGFRPLPETLRLTPSFLLTAPSLV